jgi:hypothetical protein
MVQRGESRANPATTSDAVTGQRSTERRSRINSSTVLAGAIMACVGGVHGAAAGQKDAAPAPPAASAPGRGAPYGWNITNAGDPRYEKYGPRELTNQRQLNEPVGEAAADRIARGLGLDKSKTFTEEQFFKFVTGQGHQPLPGPLDKDCPELVDKSVRILTNTIGNPLVYEDTDAHGKSVFIATVLASYGLMVNEAGLLQSPANTAAPTREVNRCLIPVVGYLDRWAKLNGAEASIAMLRSSAYESEFPYGHQSQQEAPPAQLVINQKPSRSAKVGMSMPPALWNINFSLIYTLKPKLAANMPARWAPIPAPVADALMMATDKDGNLTGQVPFSDYKSYFEGSWYPVPAR